MTDVKPTEKPASWIELIVLFGILTLIVWLAFARPSANVQAGNDNQAWRFGHAGVLEQQLEDLRAKAAHYLDNAPREYEYYFRDTTIAHAYLQTDLQSLDKSIKALINPETDAVNSQVSESVDGSAQADGLPVARLRQEWKRFMEGLDEQLGVDPDMPRLEWGSRHITEELGPVIATVGEIRERLPTSADSAAMSTSGAPAWAWPALVAWLVLVMVWFGWRVRRVHPSR